jgi:hypothetical protein
VNGIEEYLARDWHMLVSRDHGPLGFRFVMQPLMAAIVAFRVGLREARAGQTPYGWTLATQPQHRRHLAQQSWKDVGSLFLVAIAIDVIYQILVFRALYPVQALLVAAFLAFPSYLIVRSLTHRVARRVIRARQEDGR